MAESHGPARRGVPTAEDGPVQLVAFVKRRAGTSRAEFLDHWRNHHAPLIRDTPGLARHIQRYEQMAARPDDRSGWDGVAVQQFVSWDAFVAMLSDPAAAAMRADEDAFLDPASTKVVFTADRVVVIGEDAPALPTAPTEQDLPAAHDSADGP
ncbi:MAG: EthD domain-containing protein [Microthrixaceae bacterium]|nr:EthD domain-containing protein [Microthrixaceae bacterium]